MVNLQMTVPLPPAWNKNGEGDRSTQQKTHPYRLGPSWLRFCLLACFFRDCHRTTESDKFEAKFQNIAYLPSHEVGCLPPPTGCATSGSREGQSRRSGGLAFPTAAAAKALPRPACTGGCADSRPAPSTCSWFIPPRRAERPVSTLEDAWSARSPPPPRAFVVGASCRWVNGAEEIGEG